MVEQRTHNPLVAGSNPAGPTSFQGDLMKLLEEAIKDHGIIKDNDIVSVDKFLNHQIDINLVDAMAEEFIRIFSDCNINKVLTVETSGIPIAYPVAQKLDVPLIIAKKKTNVNVNNNVFSSKVISYTHFREYDVVVEKQYLNKEDSVLVIDDILANGSSLKGLLSIMDQSDANLCGVGVAIEKSFQKGSEFREQGYRIESLANIKSIDKNNQIIEFC